MELKNKKTIIEQLKCDFVSSIFLCGFFILSFIFFNIFISSLLFIFKVSIFKYTVVISLILSTILNVFILWKYKEISRKKLYVPLISIILPILSIVFSVAVNAKIYEYTYDGNGYGNYWFFERGMESFI